MNQPKLTLIIGGAASGKSAFAESLAKNTGKRLKYWATATAQDAEMDEKIVAHKRSRGQGWTTVEEPLDAELALLGCSDKDVMLMDCATLWLTNHLLVGSDLALSSEQLVTTLARTPCPVIVVTNEVGSGGIPENALSRQFQTAQGKLNQLIATKADLVVQVVAGLPNCLKGEVPPNV
jgi:adenosylcobinamide kinase/adenosylcobinamide-phosphate guanylyltransferase